MYVEYFLIRNFCKIGNKHQPIIPFAKFHICRRHALFCKNTHIGQNHAKYAIVKSTDTYCHSKNNFS